MEDEGKELRELWKKLKQYKKLYLAIDILGNIALIITLFLHQWFTAFLLFIIFFPDEVNIIRFLKKIYNRFIIAYRIAKGSI